MAQTYLILALIIQSSLIFAQDEQAVDDIDVPYTVDNEDLTPTRNELGPPEVDVIPNSQPEDWMDLFPEVDKKLYPTSSAAMMSYVTDNCVNKTAEEQVQDIKEIAFRIAMAIQSEMAHLLAYALSGCVEKNKHNETENSTTDNISRRKRETPMDSTEMVMRLLKHIKSNNDYQNIAIEKMMSAQEIADKYGIPFNPDPEVLTDFAVATSEQAKDLTSMLTETCDVLNNPAEQVEFVPLELEPFGKNKRNDGYYAYAVDHPEDMFTQVPPYEYMPEQIQQQVPKYPSFETQVQPPPHHHHHHNPPATPKPTFYETLVPDYYQPYCPVEPMTTTTTIVLPFEEFLEPEPELVGEEYEELVSSKVTIDHDAPGCSTVNHVMTYTLSEKSHFKTPQIEQLPQQMQYTFFLM